MFNLAGIECFSLSFNSLKPDIHMERTALNVLLYPEKSLSIHLSNLPYEGNWSGVTIAILQMREGR